MMCNILAWSLGGGMTTFGIISAAVTETDPAGIFQGGAVAILGAIIFVIFKTVIPEQQKQIIAVTEKFAERLEQAYKENRQETRLHDKETRDEFREMLSADRNILLNELRNDRAALIHSANQPQEYNRLNP